MSAMAQPSAMLEANLAARAQTLETAWAVIVPQLINGAEEVFVQTYLAEHLGPEVFEKIKQRIAVYFESDLQIDHVPNEKLWRFAPVNGRPLSATGLECATPPSEVGLRAYVGDSEPPRPRNSFIMYRHHHHARVANEHPDWTNAQISIYLGHAWHAESDEVKQEWKDKAAKEREEHARMFPHYTYNPRKAGEKKRRNKKRKTLCVIPPEELAEMAADKAPSTEWDPAAMTAAINELLEGEKDNPLNKPEFLGPVDFDMGNHLFGSGYGEHDLTWLEVANLASESDATHLGMTISSAQE